MEGRCCCHYLMHLPGPAAIGRGTGFALGKMPFCFTFPYRERKTDTAEPSAHQTYCGFTVKLLHEFTCCDRVSKNKNQDSTWMAKKFFFYFNPALTLLVLAGSKARIAFPPPSLFFA